MSPLRRKPASDAPPRDPRVVVIARPVPGGFELSAFRGTRGSVEPLAESRFEPSDARAAKFVTEHRAARTVVALTGADVIVRAVQLPSADEARLEGALQLNASTVVLGRTAAWRVASALLPRERGDGVRTGIVAEWPEDAARPEMPAGIEESPEASFAPAIAGLAALAASADGPLVWVDARDGVVSISVPTSRGLLARTIRAGAPGERIAPSEISLAVGEACVHAGVPGSEIPAAIAAANEAAAAVLDGGFGFVASDLAVLNRCVGTDARDASWWRANGLDVGLALAATGAALPLTRLQSSDLGAKPDRAGILLNRLSEPRTAKRLLVAGLVAVLLGPLAIEGLRLLLLKWKLPDLDAYVKAEDLDRRKQSMYRVLSRQGASMTKTLSDLACCAPEGIEIEFINVTQSARGQAVTVRGKARAAGSTPATEVMLAMETQLRETGAFDAIQRSSEAPDARGYQEFSLNATATRPTYLVAFNEDQDFGKKSMRERRFGPMPEDVDLSASGLDAREAAKPAAKSATPGTAKPADSTTSTADAGRGPDAATTAKGSAPADAPTTVAASTGAPKAENASAAVPKATTTEDPAAADAGGKDSADPKAAARAARAGSGRGGLATRSNPGGSSEPEPLPPALTENEINQMSKEEARQTLGVVSKARSRADLDDEAKARLKREFDLLLERCRKD